MLDRRPLNAMAPLCEEHGVGILAYGVLAGGFLTERYLGQPPPRVRPDTASLGKYLQTIERSGGWGHLQKVLGVCNQVASRHGVSIANVAIRWVLNQPAVAGVIIGARLGKPKANHIQDNLAALHFEFEPADEAEIEAVQAQHQVAYVL